MRAEQHCRGRRRRLRLEPARSGARSGGTSRAALYRPLARPRSSATRDPARDLRRRRAAAWRAGRGPVRRTWAAPGVSHRAPARSRIPTLQTGPSGDANFGADSHPLNCLQIGNFRRLAGPLQRPVSHDFPSGPPRRAAAPGDLGSAQTLEAWAMWPTVHLYPPISSNVRESSRLSVSYTAPMPTSRHDGEHRDGRGARE